MLGHEEQEQESQKASSVACTTRRPENRGRDGSQHSVNESAKDCGKAEKRWAASSFEEVNDGGKRPINTSTKRSWKLALNESFAKFDAALRRLEAYDKSDSDHQVNKRRAQAAAERDKVHMMIYKRFLDIQVRLRHHPQDIVVPSWYIDMVWKKGKVLS